MTVQLEDDLAAHARPDHDVELQDGKESRDRAVVCHIVSIDDALVPASTAATCAVDHTPQMARQLRHPNPKTSRTRCQGLRRVTVDKAILVDARAENRIRLFAGDAVRGIGRLARQRLLMA